MKKMFNKPVRYAFCVTPLVALFAVIHLYMSTINVGPSVVKTPAITLEAIDSDNNQNADFDLPCGFVSHGKQQAEKPTFVTNNYIPILQYPAGNFPGTTTQVFNTIYSEHQNDVLELQVDGNLVLYCLSCSPKKALWSSKTNGKDGRALFFQADGNLVLKNTQGNIIWQSNIRSKCPGSERAYFTLQDDGNLAMLYDDPADGVTYYLGGTGSGNDQTKMTHPGKIE